MKIKFRSSPRGYWVHAGGKEWGQVDCYGVGLFGKPFWYVSETRDRKLKREVFKDAKFKTRQEAAEALINAHTQGK